MNCPNCKSYNPGSARFCSECGTALASLGVDRQSGSDQPGSRFSPVLPAAGAQPAGQLISRDVGQLINETFAIYRRSFRVLWPIALIAEIPAIIGAFVPNQTLAAALSLASVFTGLLAGGAVTYAVSQQYLGRPVTVGACYVAALNRALSLLIALVVFMVVMFGAVLLSLILIGIPLLIYIVVAFFFFVQVIIIERKGPIDALTRSRQVVRGSWWRVFGIGIVFVLLIVAISFVVAIPAVILFGFPDEVLGDVFITLGGALLTPLGYVGATLVYFDLRVRKEGYTLETLATEVG